MEIKSYASMAPGAKLQPFTYTSEELGPWDIRVEIENCGICHSDIHLIDNDWQMGEYPMVPGHEIVGSVAELGKQVSHLELGQRVGIGWQRSSCLSCEQCTSGRENLCALNQATCLGHFGGFAEWIVSDSRFAFPIPESLSSENAAPLLCGGATVYSPLVNFGVRPSMKVGVIGIGGLGHLAIQFARAMGCEVTAFSSSANKAAEASEFGAHHFVNSVDPKELEERTSCYDFLIATVFSSLDWPAYINTLKPRGNLCFVGAVLEPAPVPIFPLIMGERSVSGSAIGSRSRIAEMLAFAARHGIEAKTQVMKLSEAEAAVQKVREGKARYRMVLDARS